ncbi:hypothetical protein BH11PLA2_BH11PLA2_32950 [soil metagenome]
MKLYLTLVVWVIAFHWVVVLSPQSLAAETESTSEKQEPLTPPESAPMPRIAVEKLPVVESVSPELKRLIVAKDFKVELIHTVLLNTQGSWVSLATDGKGRLIACDQGQKGLFRITLGGANQLVEKMPVDLSGAQGMVWKSGSLYAFKSGAGIYRVTDSEGDDRLDKAELISAVSGTGEHGNHALLDSGEPNLLYAVAGNHTSLPSKENITGRRVQSWQEDQLLMRQWDPRGHARGLLAPGGWVTRFDTQKKTHEVFCIGFRNTYDAATNAHGDMFTFDADMEWDLGLPWYRPIRICQVVSGGDFGWRSGSGKFPEYYEDSLPATINIGPGSPTGVVSGQTAKFPARYQNAMFALDWTYGRILAIHLQPQGAGYKAEAEMFVAGTPLPVTDAVIGSDGALYFTTGGRGAQSSLMRVVYTGTESTAPAQPAELPKEAKLRRELERFHGVVEPKAVAAAWPHLASEDRFLRNAARVAIESQPVATWAERVFKEPHSQARITAAVALARMGKAIHREPLIKSLLALDIRSLQVSQQLGILRAYSLVFERLGKPTAEERTAVIAALDPFLPSVDANLNSELLRVLVYLEAPNAVAKGMKLIETRGKSPPLTWAGVEKMNARYGAVLEQLIKNPPPTAAIGYAYTLRNSQTGWTPQLHRQYFTFINVAGKAAGGASYPGYLAGIRDEALTACTDKERIDLKDLTKEDFNPVPDFAIKPPVGPGREWTLKEAIDATTPDKLVGSNFERGRSLFHAVNCAGCHRFKGLGGGVGPDLTSVLNKFTTAYLVEAIINPSKDISDQYQSSTVTVNDGRILTGLAIKEGARTILVYSSDPKAKPVRVAQTDVDSIRASPVSQMPTYLFNTLNPTELRDLVGYIMSGGDPKDKLYRTKKKK